MNHLQKFTAQVRDRLVLLFLINNLIVVGDWWVSSQYFALDGWRLIAMMASVPLVCTLLLPFLMVDSLVQPMKAVWQAVLHLSPQPADTPAPDLAKIRLGKELITNLVSQMYQIASIADSVAADTKTANSGPGHDFVATNLPLPLMILDADNNVVFANQAMCKYLRKDSSEVVSQNVYSVIDMSFGGEHTFDEWLQDAKANKPVAAQTWERVRLNLSDENQESDSIPQFDLAAYYNQGNPEGMETMLVMFDHTQQYSQDDQAMSFVALAVHELRTPLTLLRGYVEAFQEELQGKLDPELDGFLKKMAAASQQLATFVNTILNVSRVENDQMSLELREENWSNVLQTAIGDMRMRAEVRGVELDLQVDDNLPAVGIDRTSIYEVIVNLVDNAIKYSNDSKKVIIHSYLNKEGRVETTVQDFGVGIQSSAIGSIFEKFYRNHRNRAQIGGTGMGLYLSKAIVTAHGGDIWVRSKENEGSTFGFTVLPFGQLAEANKTSHTDASITRTAHGWIKNHSLYRR